jgi:signal transduction histidine kinase
MQIRTQQTIGALVSTLVVGTIVATLFSSMQHTEQAIRRSNYAASIIAEGISGLRLVTVEYIVFRNERARLQWQQRHESLARHLAENVFEESVERSMVEEIRLQNQDLNTTFSALVELDRHYGKSVQEIALLREAERQLVTQLMLISQDSVIDATRLGRITAEQLGESRYRTNWLLAALVALMGLVIATNFAMSLSQILTPIKRLKQGAEAFTRGELGFRTGLRVNNELGELSQVFDLMVKRLAETMTVLKYKTAQLQETNRELESFSYSVSHDLRSPLRGIDGWGLALIEDYGAQLDATAHTYLERIRHDTQRMGHLIDDLLQLARVTRSEIKHEAVDLSALAHTIAERLQQAHSGRRIEFLIQPGLNTQGDPRLLEIALTNLLDNACKFTSPRPEARIEFGETLVEVPETSVLQRAYFVRDNGVGFDMTHAQRLFGAFQRMHKTSEFQGTGIGLATVQRIVHRHGGKVWADAKLDQGATFYFSLSQTDPFPLGVVWIPEDGIKEAA